jgi:hypothetical protein
MNDCQALAIKAGGFHPLRRRIAMLRRYARRLCTVSALPLGPADDHIDVSAATLSSHRPLAPIEDRCVGAKLLCELGGVRVDLVSAAPTPDDQPTTSR